MPIVPSALVKRNTANECCCCCPPCPVAIIYFPGNGSGGSADLCVECGSEYMIKTAAEAGVTDQFRQFKWWSTEPDGEGEIFYPGDEIIVCDDLVLYAQWGALT